jgi:hypothetical protein
MNEESESVIKEEVGAWKTKVLTSLLSEYRPEDIFNAGEYGLFLSLIPNKTYAFKDKSCLGNKRSKERIIVLVYANMAGSEKMLIGKSEKRR